MNGLLSGSSFYAALVLSALLQAAAAGAALFLGARRLTAGRLLGSTFVLLGAFVLEAPFLIRLDFGAFAFLHLIYLHLAVTLPVLGVLVLIAGLRSRPGPPRRQVSGGAMVLAAASLTSLPLSIQATFIEPFRLQTETASVPLRDGRSGSRPVRVGVISDIQTDHVTDYERSAVERLMALGPDLILVPGDLFQGWPGALESELASLRDLLSRLYAPGGVYFVLGDADRRDEIERIIEGTTVKLIVNETVRTAVGDRTISICGVERRCEAAEARRAIRDFTGAPGEGDIRILLSHSPDAALELEPGTRADLVVSGHTHGGQVQVPSFGPLLTLSSVPRRVAAGGLHDLDRRWVYVSRGVGHERRQAPRLRFNCPPEIALVTLGRP